MMSVRDAMYDAMFDDTNPWGIQRSRILVDIVHVGDYGASVYASFLAWALRHQMTRALLHHRCGASFVLGTAVNSGSRHVHAHCKKGRAGMGTCCSA